jgi:hypothetical protein
MTGVSEMRTKEDKENNLIDIIQELKKVVGAHSYDGDASLQVLLPTVDGRMLRIGITDEDVADLPGEIWFDYYPGLNSEIQTRLYRNRSSLD